MKLQNSGLTGSSWSHLKKAGNAGSRICLIQGACDPHPADGVIRPLEKNHVKCEAYILDQCGHSPFMEKYAREEFYEIIRKICKKGLSGNR